jgi:hypothetical protein
MTTTRKRGRPSKAEAAARERATPSYERLTQTKNKMPMKRVYICSPYAGYTVKEIERHTNNARSYCRKAFDDGYVPLAPHLYYPQFLDDWDKDERAAGLRYGLEEMHRCRELWVFGQTISKGMQAEIDLAKDLKIPVKYFYVDGEAIEN